MGRWLGAVLALLALVWLWLVDNYIPDIPTEGEPGPRAFPFLLGIVLAALGTLMALQRGADAGGDDASEPAGQTPSDASARGEWTLALATFAALIGHAFLLDKLGFLVATALLAVLATTGILRMRNVWFVAAFALSVSASCWFVFRALLGIPLPGGSWVGWLQ